MTITCILVIIGEKFPQCVLAPLPKKLKTFPEIFIAFSQSTQKFLHVKKKTQLYSLNISEVIDSEKCGYLNARKLLFSNILRESTSWRVLTTAKITMAALSSKISINITRMELENISVSQF